MSDQLRKLEAQRQTIFAHLSREAGSDAARQRSQLRAIARRIKKVRKKYRNLDDAFPYNVCSPPQTEVGS